MDQHVGGLNADPDDTGERTHHPVGLAALRMCFLKPAQPLPLNLGDLVS
jgi:hypothetical protein